MIPHDFFQQTHNYLIIIAGLFGLIVGLISNSDKLMNYIGKKLTIRGLNQVEDEDIKDNTYIGEKLKVEDKMNSKLDEIIELVSSNQKGIAETKVLQKRQEILQLIQSQPHRVESIERTYDDYKALGGNSYIDDVVQVWRETTAISEIKNRITKRNKNG